MLKLILFVLSSLNLTVDPCCPPVGCDLMTFSTVRPAWCECNETCTTAYTYPVGFSRVNVTFDYPLPVAQDFYQKGDLIARCPADISCRQSVDLDPEWPLVTNVTAHLFDEDYTHTMTFIAADAKAPGWETSVMALPEFD
jgi:hypothetical protein